MDDKDVTKRTLSLSSSSNYRRIAVIAAVITAVGLILGGCDGSESPQWPSGGTSYDDGYHEYDGGNNPGRFDPKPPQGPFSP
jgi:hypothetical protein